MAGSMAAIGRLIFEPVRPCTESFCGLTMRHPTAWKYQWPTMSSVENGPMTCVKPSRPTSGGLESSNTTSHSVDDAGFEVY